MNCNLLAPYVQCFFQDFLVVQRNVSRNTLMSYRDTFRLFLGFTSQRQCKAVPELLIEDVGPDTVLAFLDHLERERDNAIASRNIRAAALRMFFRYLASQHPPAVELCRRAGAIPLKKHAVTLIGYLESDELQALLSVIDRRTVRGRRDYTLLWLLYDTGARVQEILDLKVAALRLEPPEHIRVLGKGRKERVCPLSKEVATLVLAYLKERAITARADASLFVGRHGEPMTRSGIGRLIKKYATRAAKTMPTLQGRKITPHSFRHTCAMHLLQAGVDLNVIRAWLGHASVTTTHQYVQIDMKMKRRALEALRENRGTTPKENPTWHRQPGLLEWLETI